MSRRRIDVRKLREILRLHYQVSLSANKIATSVNISRGTVQEYLRRARVNKLAWPLPESLDDTQLETLLYPSQVHGLIYVEPDWESVHRELKEKGITRELIWLEYKSDCHQLGRVPYSYQQYCRLYQLWAKNIAVVMRQEHLAGQKLFVDFAGKTIPVIDPGTGEVTQAQVFVAVLGASNYTYVEACASQKADDWIAAHIRAFQFFAGVPELLVPDNLKSAVIKQHRYEPVLNERYHQMARHFDTSIMPARSGKPKDKAKVEKGVQFVTTWITAVLRKQTFFSLSELNFAIAGLLEKLNNRPFKKLTGSRRTWFESIDRPALKQLPFNLFEDARWMDVTVGEDHHVEIDRHFYSVPYTLKSKRIQARVTANTVEFLFKGNRVASHKVSHLEGKSTTDDEHRPEAHRHVNNWTEERLLNWAARIGPATTSMCSTIISNSRHPSVGIQTALGLLSLHKEFGQERVEKACRHASQSGGWTVKNIRSFLKHGLDKKAVQLSIPALSINAHENLRGANYFTSTQEYPSC